jgi:hypothetical protein
MRVAAWFRIAALTTIALVGVPCTAHAQEDRRVRLTRSKRPAGPVLLVFVRSNTVHCQRSDIEQALIGRRELSERGVNVTQVEGDADLVLEVRRRVLNIFGYRILNARTGQVIADGRIGSLGGSVEGQIARSFAKHVRAARGRSMTAASADNGVSGARPK